LNADNNWLGPAAQPSPVQSMVVDAGGQLQINSLFERVHS
jgi:hypothetical protein